MKSVHWADENYERKKIFKVIKVKWHKYKMHGKERIEETQKRRKKSSKDRNIFYNELKVYINE